ncbi:MAG TPA: zinc-ribbon domain-containing protein, partial [Polyangiaceae bacterium]|nr:zinc-ribbon domain-containing protein [Polyangiaceae bacterium]
MFKVECPGCNAPYQVDERRVPATGLKMRCPKCGTSFKVDAPAENREVGAGVQSAEPAMPPPPPRRPGRDSPLKSTMLGVPPPGAGGPAAARPRAGEPTAAQRTLSGAYEEVDLPTVGGGPHAPPQAAPAPPQEIDLPARVNERPERADLPAAAPPRPRPQQPKPPAPPRRPAPAAAPAVPAAPVAPAPAMPEFGEVDLPAALSMKFKAPVPPPDADLPSLGRAPPQPIAGGRSAAASTRETEPEPVIPDLPSVGFARAPAGFGEIDLPATSPGRASPSSLSQEFALDLEADLPAAADVPGLPSPAAGLPVVPADLPSPSASLPSPAAS